jgi:hypothetical protein
MAPRGYSETVAMLSLYLVCTLPLTPIFLLVTRRVVDARLRQADADIAALLLTLARHIGVASLAGVVLAYLGRAALSQWLHVSEPATPPIFAVSVATSALYLLVAAVLFGRLNWPLANTLQVLLAALRIAFSLVLVRPGFEVSGAFAAISVSAVLCLAIGFVGAMRGLPRGGQYRALHLGEVGLAVTVNLAFWFLVQVDTIYVNRALPGVAEQYAAAAALGKMLVYVPVAVGNAMFPLLSGAGDSLAARRVVIRMLTVAGILAAAGLLILAAAPTLILGLTLGPSHLGAARYLLPVSAVMAPFAFVSVFLYDVLARHDRRLNAVFAGTAVSAAAVLLVAPHSLTVLFGTLLGAAAVILISGFVRAGGTRPGAPPGPARP